MKCNNCKAHNVCSLIWKNKVCIESEECNGFKENLNTGCLNCEHCVGEYHYAYDDWIWSKGCTYHKHVKVSYNSSNGKQYVRNGSCIQNNENDCEYFQQRTSAPIREKNFFERLFNL